MRSRCLSLLGWALLLQNGCFVPEASAARPGATSSQKEAVPSLNSSFKQVKNYERHRLEQMFGKYFGKHKGFDIYGVVKHDGSWDREDDSTVSGVIVAPEGSQYSHFELKAELKYRADWLYGSEPSSKGKRVIETCTTRTEGGGWDTDEINVAPLGEKPQYKKVCHRSFMWECPRSVDTTTLRVTDLLVR